MTRVSQRTIGLGEWHRTEKEEKADEVDSGISESDLRVGARGGCLKEGGKNKEGATV